MLKKGIALILMAFVTAISAFAENKVYIPDFEIEPGQTKKVELCLDIDFDLTKELGVDIYMPEGLSFKSTKPTSFKATSRLEFKYYDEDEEEWMLEKNPQLMSTAVQEDGALRVGALGLKCNKGNGAIFTINVVATSDFAGGDIELKNIVVSGKSYADQKTTVTTPSAGGDVKMVINAGWEYGTFCAPFDVAIPEGIQAYSATVSGNTVSLTEISTTIPANTAVIVKNDGSAFTKTVSGTAVAGTTTTDALTGVLTDTPATEGTYVLQNHDGKIAFYLVKTVKPTIGANRCYLTAPSSEAKAIYFDEATAIAALQNASSIEGAYSASGVKNNGLKKGVNIVKMGDGSVQKIMVK